jgi:excisionase family DNA binding protein
MEEKKLISTGQAAKLCSVTPDTILKWIKKSQIVAIQTAGGHYRINRDHLEPFIAEFGKDVSQASPATKSLATYCWEYHSADGQINDNCRQCMVFKSKAEKCYLMAGLGKDGGHSGIFCKNSCYECDYFHFVNKPKSNVLIITENQVLEQNLQANIKESINLKFSCCGYETSTIIQDFNPDFIILDESLTHSSSDELCKHLIQDPRLHGAQIILAVTDERKERNLQEGICATIKIPFGIPDLEECLLQLQKNFFGSRKN